MDSIRRFDSVGTTACVVMVINKNFLNDQTQYGASYNLLLVDTSSMYSLFADTNIKFVVVSSLDEMVIKWLNCWKKYVCCVFIYLF